LVLETEASAGDDARYCDNAYMLIACEKVAYCRSGSNSMRDDADVECLIKKNTRPVLAGRVFFLILY